MSVQLPTSLLPLCTPPRDPFPGIKTLHFTRGVLKKLTYVATDGVILFQDFQRGEVGRGGRGVGGNKTVPEKDCRKMA